MVVTVSSRMYATLITLHFSRDGSRIDHDSHHSSTLSWRHELLTFTSDATFERSHCVLLDDTIFKSNEDG